MLCYALEISPNCDLAGGLIKVFVAGAECVGAARVFTIRLTDTTFYLAMAMLALVLVPGTNLAFRKTPLNHDGSEGPSSVESSVLIKEMIYELSCIRCCRPAESCRDCLKMLQVSMFSWPGRALSVSLLGFMLAYSRMRSPSARFRLFG